MCAWPITYTEGRPIRDKQQKCALNENMQGVRTGVIKEDFGVPWVWGFRGDSQWVFLNLYGHGMDMGIEIQSPLQL